MPKNRSSSMDLMFPDRLPSPRRSLQTKAIGVVFILVAVPTMLCGYLTQRHATDTVERSLMQNASTLAEATSQLVASGLRTERIDKRAMSRAVGRLTEDQRVAFLVVTRPDGSVIEQWYNEPLAWHTYRRKLSPKQRNSTAWLNRSKKLTQSDGATLVVRRQAVRAPAGGDGGGTGIAAYVALGLHSPKQMAMRRELQDATIGVVAVILLVVLPLVVWWVRGWIKPLRDMLAAALKLGVSGRGADRVRVRRDDEIGLLGRAFNAMADNLARIQNALVEANAQLERKVAERTDQLEQANRRLQREIREKDQFIRAVSHDLGAPLRNIAGLTSMLMVKHKDQMDGQVVAKLERISANVKAENELIQDLLELSRIRKRPDQETEVDLEELLSGLRDQLSYDLEQKDIELRVDTDLPTVRAERNRMRQLFQNLIDNAIKYMPADNETRRIHVGQAEVDGEWALYVRDTGQGIEPKDQKEIFGLFRRARYSGARDEAGRGVGLASVKAIVECYGGRIWLHSEPPNGATFYFTLGPDHWSPAADVGAAQAEPAAGEAGAVGASG